MDQEKKEERDLYIIVGIMLAAVCYHLSLALFSHWSHKSLAMGITSGLFFWLVGMLWIAYQRWQKTKQSRDLLNDVISSTGQEVVAVIDYQGRVLLCNEAIIPVLGYELNEFIGMNMDRIYEEVEAGWDRSLEMRKTLSQVGFHRGEVKGRRKDGVEICLEIALSYRNKGIGLVMILRDITERKNYEENLRSAKDLAESEKVAKEEALTKLEASYQRLRELEIRRDSLVHMVCHDMKAPIQVLILQLDLLKEMVLEKLDNHELESVDTLLVYTRQLEIMVNSMLDVSKLECGKFPLQPQTADVVAMVKEAIDFVQIIGLDRHFTTNTPQNVRKFGFDPDVVNRILVNLLFNAVKCSPPESRISVVMNFEQDQLRVDIMDEGHGIGADEIDKIWEKFQQADSRKLRSGTTGLGLTFCKLAVEAHKGSIGVNSVLGQGSTFWFTLPYEFAGLRPRSALRSSIAAN